MEKDQRLTPLPTTVAADLQTTNQDYPAAYAPFYDDETFDEKRSIRQYFHIVYKRLPIILALTILTTAAAAFYMYRQSSIFEASTEIIIEPRKPRAQSKEININFNNDINYYNTQLQLLRNPDLMRDVMVELGLHRQPNLFANQNKGMLATFRSIFSSEKPDETKTPSLPVLSENAENTTQEGQIVLTPEEKVLAAQYAGTFLQGLRVEQRERTNLVTLSVTSTNPELAARVANKVAETFIKQDEERELQGTKQAVNELSKSIDQLKGTIAEQELQLINLLRSSNLPLQDKGSELRNNVLTTVYGQYQEARNERLKIEARYNTAVAANNRGEGANIPDLTESEIYRDTKRLSIERKAKLQDQIREIDKQIQQTETEKAELLVKYTPEYFKVKQAEEKIASLKTTKDKTEKEVTQIIDRDDKKLEKDAVSGALVALRSQLDAAQKREAQLYSSYMSEEAKANLEGQTETQLTTLKRGIETNRNLLDTYTQRQKEQELALSSIRPDNIKITSQAVTPTYPIGPNRTRNILVAFLLSLAAGIGLAFLMDYLDDSVRTSDDVGRNLGLPTLALIPHHNSYEKPKTALTTTNGINGSMALVTLKDRRSPMAEAYRHLRTSLLFSSAGKPPQTILVTSSQPSEGKTTTAINTAITLAQSNADVVIIDCDLRRPRLHSHFGMENSNGLTNYLSGEKETANLLKTCPDLPRLKIITSGPIPPNPAELLSSNEMRNLLQFLKGNYKHVIIDSPPAISFTDAAILSTLVDGVVLVAMAGKSSIHLMRRFKQRLGTIGARIYGVVLNGIKANSTDYDYYGYGYTYSYYTHSEGDDSTPLMEEKEPDSSIHITK
ncbi:MAG: polysaccharide biosynthesis tyrosine autokinase [Pyrinomonadaceae bacterium]|nr:polysaccharide biosynthesis tyrosine autokinase [Pyrinomonadaceae bacterium]